jgi:penicillin G amidase
MRHRAAAAAACCGLLLGAGFAGPFPVVSAPEPVALVGATLIDGRGGAPAADAVVVVRGGRIECAGARAACPVPDDARVVDVRGRWLMPGIVDAHVHYSQTGWADGRPDALDMRRRFPYERTVAALRDPTRFYRAHLCAGVTATFDVGGYPWTWDLRTRSDTAVDAPHVAAAGPLLSTRDHWLNMPAERQFLHIATDSAVLDGAAYLAANRTDAIKVWFIHGATAPDSADWTRRVRLAGDAARAAGIPLIVHATALWQAKHALHAGAQLLVHGVGDREVDDEFIALARRNGTVYTPTLVVTDGYRQLRARHFEHELYGESLRCVDPATLARAFLTDSLPGAVSPAVAARARETAAQRFELEAANVRRVHAAGIPIAMGTDAGNPLTLHGPSVYLEMEALQRAGLTAMEVIVAATRNGALAMNRLDDLGTIEAGKSADLVVLAADPTADIRHVRRVEQVMRGGRLHARAALEWRSGSAPAELTGSGQSDGQESFEALARAALARIDGVAALAGLRDTVEVIRDRWGVPHIYARNLDDLFFAQGYVHAQDRLWQMDMYRRMFEGRMAEVMGPSYVAHDRLARLLRHDGPWDEREWTTYHPEGRRIFEAFAGGVNAFIADATGPGGSGLPVEFRITGLEPGRWTATTSLLRTQTALPIGDARSELNLARSVAQYGADEANRRARPSPWRELVVPAGLDVTAIDSAVIAGLAGLRTGTPRPPLLPQYERLRDALPNGNRGAQEDSPGSNNWVVGDARTASGRVMVANDPHRSVSNPSIRYIVHLNAPGWDVIGATEAPLPGVAIGHNGRIAWGLTIVGTDQSDVYVEQVNPANRNEVRFRGTWEPLRIALDTIHVRNGAPVVVERKHSRHGPIFHEDTVRNLAYAIRTTAHEPGTAGYLGALRYHALRDCREFLDAQVYYRAPTENMICGDADGNIAWQASALSPRRPNWHGRLPVPGTGEYEWNGFRDDLPRELNPERGWIATANHDIHPPGYDPPLFFKTGPQTARFDRLAALLSAGSRFTIEDMKRLQLDSYLLTAERDIALFRGWHAADATLERARRLIAEWDGYRRRESAAAALHGFVAPQIEAAARAADTAAPRRQQLLERALRLGLAELHEAQGADPAQWRWGRSHRSEFPHALVRAYDIAGVERDGGSGTIAATGATYRQVIDFANLDASVVTNAPGQSAQPLSPFYANLAEPYGRGEFFPLVHTRVAVERAAAHRLVLTPRR